MIKLLVHLVIFLLGAGVGIWWGAGHPDAAANIVVQEQQQVDKIQAAVSQAKIELLQKFLANSDSSSTTDPNNTSSDSGYQRMLNDEQQKLADVKKRLEGGGN